MKIDKNDLSVKLGEYGHQIIQKNYRKLIDQEKTVLVDKDPEAIHQMRVRMRCLRTAIQLFGTALVLPNTVSDPSIRKVSRSLGRTRDLDVLQELVIHYQPLLSKAERPIFSRAQRYLSRSRNKSFQQVKKVLQSERYHQLKQGIQTWTDSPVYTLMGELPVQQNLADLLLPLICRLFLHPGWLVGTTIQDGVVTLMPIENPDELNQQLELSSAALHDLRKQIKRVRYQLEFFSDFYDKTYLRRIEEFKNMQDMLGQLHDQFVLCQFLESTLQEDLITILPGLDQVMRQEQIEFWKNWQPLQQNYLSPDFRQSLRPLFVTLKVN